MGLKELWDKLVEKASEEERAVASFFEAHIAKLHDELGEEYAPKEYPKWVDGKVFNDAEEEAALRASREPAPAPVAETPTAPPAPVIDPPAAPAAAGTPEAPGEAS